MSQGASCRFACVRTSSRYHVLASAHLLIFPPKRGEDRYPGCVFQTIGTPCAANANNSTISTFPRIVYIVHGALDNVGDHLDSTVT